jgi:hypothetical protein
LVPGEENEEFDFGQIFTEAATLSDSKGYDVRMRNKRSVAIKETFRLERLRFWGQCNKTFYACNLQTFTIS